MILEYIPAYLKMAGETNPSLILSEMIEYGMSCILTVPVVVTL